MDVVYCADGNRRFAQIAIDHGYLYGSQLPKTVYFPPWFADQNWKNPDRAAYMTALAQHHPHMASVLDLEREEQLDEVLSWAEEAAQYVKVVMIIPKVFGIIPSMPRRIGTADVRLGYSVPTKFGGTMVPAWEFYGWPVHLLGGQPQIQMQLAHYMDVRSVDGNYAGLMARKFGEFWTSNGWRDLTSAGYMERQNAMYEAFRRSCENIMRAWQYFRA